MTKSLVPPVIPVGRTARLDNTDSATRESTDAVATPPGRPAQNGTARLYGSEFAADPSAVYARLRGVGPAAVVEIAPGVSATLVTSYGLALRVLRDPEAFPRDPRGWQASLPSGCPVLPMLGFRPNALFSDGLAHARLRAALADSLGQIDPRWLRAVVERSALVLVEEVAGRGEAELVAGFAARLPVMMFTELLGCPAGLATEFMTHLPLIFDAGTGLGRLTGC